VNATVLVIHPYFHSLGGAEQVFLHTVNALAEREKEVYVLGELPKQSKFRDLVSANVVGIPYSKHGFRFRRFQVYQRFIYHELFRSKLRRKIGAVDLEVLTQDPMSLLDVGKKKVAYVHYPENLWHLDTASALLRSFWRIFYLPVSLSLQRQVNKIDLILCNSNYTRKAIQTKWKRTATVLYPPVDVENFKPAPKKDLVVSVGRFVRTKNFEIVLEVAKRLPQLKFVIIGRKESYDPYYSKINSSKPDNVTLLANLSSSEMSSVLGTARVYLHTMIGEHFGIRVVEAMAAGCLPIEIVDRVGCTYDDIDECVDCINRALSSKQDPKSIAEGAQKFSSDNFKKAFLRTLESKGFL
jgi:alpha-1,2-mannosyltransferase